MKLSKGKTLFVAAALCSSFAAGLPNGEHVIHEKRDAVPEHWTKISEAKGDAPIELRFALKQNNLHRAEEYMRDVSDPKSKNYGKFWTPQQVIATFASSDEAMADTVKWLMQMGVSSKSIVPTAGRNWLKVKTTVAEAEKLLKTTYSTYQDDEGTILLACEEYALPSDLQEHIDFVSPTIQFDTRNGAVTTKRISKRDSLAPHAKKVDASVDPESLDNCSELTTPACLRAIYQIPPHGEAVEGNSLGVLEFAPQSYNQEDLNTFYTVYASNVPNYTSPIVDRIDGGFLSNASGPSTRGESNLDLCYTLPFVYPLNVTLYQTGDSVPSNPATYNNFLDAIDGSYCTFEGGDDKDWDATYPYDGSFPGAYTGEPTCGAYSATNVISVSYGAAEANRPISYNTRECNEYMKLGLMGVSLLFASGDTGTAGNTGQCLGPGDIPVRGSGRFSPLFPASCPWVTTVGGSSLPPNGTVHDRQVTPTDFIPGGGFSNHFGLPDYQASAVASYYALHDPGYNSSVYNNTQAARGFPDVAVLAMNFITGMDGGFQAFTGTSASVPTFATMITLINGDRIKAGKGPLGFLNPILYAHPEMFDDIVEGVIKGCGSNGFSAVEGWDPASGLGAPNYQRMRHVMTKLP